MRAYGAEYYQSSSAENRQYDELMIANMLNALNNPHILNMLDDDELKTLLQAVKNHVVIKSKAVLKWQEDYEKRNGMTR